MTSFLELTEKPQMLPPPPGSFIDREELIQHVGEYAISQGYVVTIKQSKKDKVVVLGCDRGGVYRNRRKPVDETSGGHQRQRKTGSRLTNCPFELVGKKEDGLWVLTIKNGSHNHEALKDFSEHPTARRFTEGEVMLIKEMTEAGLKPRQILKRLRQSNPELLSTPKHVYNVKAKIRQGNLTVRRFKTLETVIPAEGNSQPSTSGEPSWRKRYPSRVPNLIGGRFVDSQSLMSTDVLNPATQQVVAQVPLTTHEEFQAAVLAAKRAFPLWRNAPFSSRQRIMFKLQELIRRDIDKLLHTITTEQGKTLKDAYNEVYCGLEAVEYACGMASLQMGDFVSNASSGTDTYTTREPLGVCAGIFPSNFPARVPLWMFSIAVTCGNTLILKPSEKAPGACMLLAELAAEAGLPDGVLNIVHGTNDITNAIFDDDGIKSVSLVGAEAVAKCIDGFRSSKSKPNIGFKNYAIIMPDANIDAAINALVASCFGAGQKFMAISIVVFVHCPKSWEDKLVERAKALKVDAGTEPGADLGPLVDGKVKEHFTILVQIAVSNGARLALDGRNIVVPKYELGNFVGPTIVSDVTEDMECYKEEAFGPLLLCMQAGDLDEAIGILNRHKHGYAASIFTTSGTAARKFQNETEVAQVGINCGVPAPMPFFLYSRSKASCTGDLNANNGKSGVEYYTRVKTVTQQWKNFPSTEGESKALASEDLPSNEEPLILESTDFPSNDGMFLPVVQSRDFSSSDGVGVRGDFPSCDRDSLGQRGPKDIPNSDGLSPPVAASDNLNWTLNF